MYKSLVFGDEFLALKVTVTGFCRPVKFFHTDSINHLPYTQRHCHVRIEKGPNCRSTQFPRISLYALTLRFVLMEITKVVKPVH